MSQKHLQTLLFVVSCLFAVSNAGIPPVSGYTWIPVPPINQNRTDHTATLYNGSFYLIGGCTSSGDGCLSPDGLFTIHERYDPVSYLVVNLPNLTVPRYRHVAQCIGHKIFVVGGRTAGDTADASLEIYDTMAEIWMQGAYFPDARSDQTAFVLNDLLYVYGGYDQNYNVLSSGYYYNPGTDNWTYAGDLTQARGDLMSTIMDGVVYVAGGFAPDAAQTFQELTIIDVSRDGMNWTRMTPELAQGRGDGVFLTLNENLLMIGGESADAAGNDQISNQVQVWRAQETAWRYLTPLPDERYRMAGGVVNGAAYLFGGHDSNEIPSNLVNKFVFSAASSATVHMSAVIALVLFCVAMLA